VLLVVWVASVLIVPNLSILVAGRVHPIRSRRVVDIQKERFYADEHEKNRKINRANYLEVTSERMQWSEKQRIKMLLAADEALKLGEMEAVYQNEIGAQDRIARVLSRLSPACLYQYACETLAGTGFKQYGKFMDAVKRYRRDLLSYLKAQSGRTSLIGSSPPVFRFSEHLSFRGDLSDALLDIGLLMLLGVAFFMAAYASFLRYDVT